MKIVFCGGGSGGHFYPIIAVAEALRDITREKKLIQPKLYYLAATPYDKALLFDNEIEFRLVTAGKMRRYFSLMNIFDSIATGFGMLKAFFDMYFIYPDVVFSKGGMMSLPVVLAARILRIPVIIHESDTVPGRANIFAAKFADRIAVSFGETAEKFKEINKKAEIAVVGNPLRKEIVRPVKEGAREYLNLSEDIPTIVIYGGSIGAKKINDVILNTLPELVKSYQIIHQTGKASYKDVVSTSTVVLADNPNISRYHAFDYLNALAERMVAGVATLVVSRGGSMIFEISSWGIPSIIIPITDSNGDHQRKNAYNYARSGACLVIEENNLTAEILTAAIKEIMSNPEKAKKMSDAALSFAKTDAAYKIADEIVAISLSHESA